MKTIVIADDITGANDIGVMYSKAGLNSYVFSLDAKDRKDFPDCDTLTINTDSRFDTADRAYRKVQEALACTKDIKADQYIDKQCSVFRGNIGAEFDAMLDYLGEEFAVVVLGFPNNGRTTRHGIHYVWGTELAKSQFRNDPVHPMTESSLEKILASQTKRKVTSIWYEVYDQGEGAIRAALDQARARTGYVIMDVRDNGDLKLLAKVLESEKIICGSSALSEFLAVRSAGQRGIRKPEYTDTRERVFGIAGSLQPQTISQVWHMKRLGYTTLVLDTRKLFEEESRNAEITRLVRQINEAYDRGETYVQLHSEEEPGKVAKAKSAAADRGISNTEISSLVSAALSQISAEIIARNHIRLLAACGGDTSAALCAKLGVGGMKIGEEIEAGLPVCESVGGEKYRMVLKSGSFGSEAFLEKAVKILRHERRV